MSNVTHIIRGDEELSEENLHLVIMKHIEEQTGAEIEGVAVNPDFPIELGLEMGILFVDGRRMICIVEVGFTKNRAMTVRTRGRWLPYVDDEQASNRHESQDEHRD